MIMVSYTAQSRKRVIAISPHRRQRQVRMTIDYTFVVLHVPDMFRPHNCRNQETFYSVRNVIQSKNGISDLVKAGRLWSMSPRASKRNNICTDEHS